MAELLPEHLRDQAAELEKGTDTMDVWFDSGSSWAGVAQQREGLRYPADLYLEGSDQHRCAPRSVRMCAHLAAAPLCKEHGSSIPYKARRRFGGKHLIPCIEVWCVQLRRGACAGAGSRARC